MRVIVAGCAGFIGFHLCERLLREGSEVVGVDNLVSGQEANVRDLSQTRGFVFRHADIAALPAIDGPIDFVYNLACPASPVDFRDRAIEILETCSVGVRKLADLCLRSGARLLHTSTSEVYGDPLEHPQRESYRGHVNPIGPRACYDEGKRFAEALLVNYARLRGLTVRIARIFNTYGPRMRSDDGRVLPNFIAQALAGKPLTVHGDGSQTRSFCYVADLVDGLIRLAQSDVDGPCNLGNPLEITVLQFAREVIELTGSDSDVQFVDRPVDDPSRRCPDITLARSRIGWEPRVDRRDGIERTIAWFRGRAG